MQPGLYIFLNILKDENEVNITIYQCIISKLMYLNYDIRSDIIFIINYLS